MNKIIDPAGTPIDKWGVGMREVLYGITKVSKS